MHFFGYDCVCQIVTSRSFFFYMFFVRHAYGVYANVANIVHRVHHYWGSAPKHGKAWEGSLWTPEQHSSPRLGRNLDYLSRIEPSPTREHSPCADRLAALRRSAEAHPAAQRGVADPHRHLSGNLFMAAGIW